MKNISIIYTTCGSCNNIISTPVNILKKSDWIRCNCCYRSTISPTYGTRPLWFDYDRAVDSLEKYSKEIIKRAKKGEAPVLFIGYPDVKIEDDSKLVFGNKDKVCLYSMNKIKRFFHKRKNLKKILRYCESQSN